MSTKVMWNDRSIEANVKSSDDSNKNDNEKKHSNDNSGNLEGTIEELGTNMQCCGQRNQAKCFVKTTKAIGNCVGGVHNEDVKNSVVDGP